MRITEFLLNLFIKYAPVSPEVLANLKIQLNEYFQTKIETLNNKKMKNQKLAEEAEKLNAELDTLEPHTPEYEKVLLKFEKLDTTEEPTVLEKIVAFTEKPLFKLLLVIAFVFVSRYIAKKLTTPAAPEKEPEEDERNQYQPQNGGGYYPPQNWAPYGYGNPYPPAQYQNNNKH